MRRFGMRRVAMALATIAAAAAVGVAGPAGSASAATSPLYLSQNPVTHTCNVLGHAQDPHTKIDYQGVVCVNLQGYAGYTSSLGYYVAPEIDVVAELICQVGPNQPNYGQEVQCAHAKAQGALNNAVDGTYGNAIVDFPNIEVNHGLMQCGHEFGPCSSGRNSFVLAQVSDLNTPGGCTVWTYANYWGVLYGAPSVDGSGSTGIELPGSGLWVYLNERNSNGASGNESSGHYQICPW